LGLPPNTPQLAAGIFINAVATPKSKTNPTTPAMSIAEIVDAFRKAMVDAGILYDGEITGDSGV
jgi:hypothetical protein